VNNRKVPLWNKYSFKRLDSPCLNLWLPCILGWLVGVFCLLLYLQAFKRVIIGPSSVTPLEFAIVLSILFLIFIALLIIQYLSEVARTVMRPLVISASGSHAGHAWNSQNNLENLAWACITANNELGQIDESNPMPASTEQKQLNLVDPSEKDKPSTSSKREGLNQALTIVNQIGQGLTTSLHLADITAICRAVLDSPQFKELFLFDAAEICLWNDQTKTLTTKLRLPEDKAEIQAYDRAYQLNQGYTGWVAAHQNALLINDTHQHPDVTPKVGLDSFPYRSLLAVPLLAGQKLLGTLELAAVPVNAYTQQDVTLLEIVANQMAMAIDHVRLFEETQRKVAELSLLSEASRELSSTLSYDELLRSLSRQMIRTFPADDCAIFEFDEASDTLELVHQSSATAPDEAEAECDFNKESFTRAITNIPAWQASFKEQTPFIIRLNDPATKPEEVTLLEQGNCGVMMAIPLASRDKVTGLLVLFSVDSQAFTDDQIPLAQSLTSQANIALENAHLFGLTDQRLQRRIDELAGLQRVSSELNSTLDLDRILGLVLEEALRVTKADLGNVNLYDAGTGKLVAHKEQGETDRIQAIDETSSQNGQRIMERALHTGEPILIPDVRENEDYVGFGKDTRSRVAIPIYYGGEPVGVINLESNRLNAFTRNQLRYLEALANQAAVAIGNAQVFEEQKREREQASRRIDQLSRLAEISSIFRTNRPLHEVLEDIAYAIIDSVGYNVVLISLVSDDPPVFYHEVGAGIPLAQFEELQNSKNVLLLSNLKEIMREEFRLSNTFFIPVEHEKVWQDKWDIPYMTTHRSLDSAARKPQSSDQTWQTGDLLFVPLTDTQDNIIGLLTVEDPDTGERPTISSIQTLEIFANHAATAIENARLFELEQQRRRLADTLRGVAEAISSQLEFDELLNIVLRELASVVDYDSASVQRLEEDRLVIIGGRAWEYSQQVIGLSFSMMGINPHRLVIETQEPVIIKDASQEFPESFSSPPYNRIRSWLGVPLTYGTNILGLMSLGSTKVDFFTQEDAEVALAFANQVAVAMQNARLFDEARQQVRQLAALTEVAQALNRALDLNEVLNLVLDAVFDLVGHSLGSIWLIDTYSNTVKIANTQNISDFLVELFNESAISVDSEPFASVIKSGEVLVVEGSVTQKDDIAHYGLPFPDDVTYVPLKTEQGVIGILAIENVIHHRNMLQLVTTLADLAAIAIDNTRLLENTRQRANEMQRLYNLGVEVSGRLEVQQVMRSVIDNAITLTNTQIGVILFWDEEIQRYIVDGTASSEALLAKLAFDKIQKHSASPLEKAKDLSLISGDEDDLPLWYDLTKQIMDSAQPININLSEQVKRNQTDLIEKPSFTLTKQAQALGVRAMLGVPIKLQNQTNGAIFVGSLEPRNFNDYDVQLLSFVANQAAVAMRNAQLVQRLNLFTEELEQRVAQRTEELAQTLQDLTEERDRVEALYQITRELSASLDLDRILTQALSLINRAVGISHGSILLLDQEMGGLVYRAALGRDRPLPQEKREARGELDYILAEKVVETRQYQIISDLSAEPALVSDKESLDRRSAIAVPLIIGDEVGGALLLFHPEIDYFTEDHLKLVTAAATQVATAINNAELYRLITDQADRLGIMLRTQASEAAKNEAILRGITDGVLVLDAKRNIVLLNPKAAEILEIDPAMVENQPLRLILGQSASPVAQELTQVFYDNLLASLQKIERNSPSSEFRIDVGNKAVIVTLAPVALGAEELPSIVTVLRDISKEAEVERMKNEFISTVSHELRTPLTSIKGYADLLVSSSATAHVGELNPTQSRFVGVIQSNTNRLTNLVNDILEISRIETDRVRLEFESLDIISIIKEVGVSFEGQLVQKPMNFSLDLPDSLPHVYADKSRVVQILVNLIGNAWRYTPEGGEITVRARVRDDKFVQIDVEDTGIGIVEKDLEYIFDRFFRSERTEVEMVDGTGLGLSITKSFVEMLSGEIWVKSELDVGSTFSFTLPLEATSEVTLVKEAGPVEGAQVLLIDDDGAVINLLKPRLEEVGYEVMVTSKASEALGFARNSNQTLSLIMLDLLLKEIDSFELLAQLKKDQTTANIPVVTTAFFVDQNGKDLALEIVDYISTSFDESQVFETVRFALKKTEVWQVDSKVTPGRGGRIDRVLIVNDNPDTAGWLKKALDNCGCHVQRAFNSQQALDMAASNPDLILADAKMPGLNGEIIISQFRRAPQTKDIPIIVVTDSPLPKGSNAVKMLNRESQAPSGHSFSVDALVAEIRRVDHNFVTRKAGE
jgi:GAF domain-containing protein/DNA-binding response OmpR family regulator/nitrogen-specific signal transduction histidine kinase